jgi:crotonobetainyl-CoA:carnitine CoA-transferase CaiB-like acyl-CoA transferase
MLADLGADVIKVERAGSGDQIRQYGPPFMKDRAGADTAESSYFLACNRGKRSLTVDFDTADGQEIVRSLARQSHVFIENFKAGHLARFRLDEASIREVSPDIVYLSISGFGQSGPYSDRPGLDSVFQAMGGLMSVTGEPGAPPTKIGVTIVDLITGLYGVIAILSALRGKEVLKTGGQAIDLALFDTAIAVMSHRAQDYLLSGDVPKPTGTRTTGSAPAQVFRCRDGWMNIQAGDDVSYGKLCRALDRADLLEDVRFKRRLDRWQHRDVLLPLIEAEIARHARSDLYEKMIALDMVCSPVYSLDQTFADPQVVHRKVRRTVEHPVGGEVPIVGNPLHFSKTPIERYAPPPTLGQHTDEVLREVLGLDEARIATLHADRVL